MDNDLKDRIDQVHDLKECPFCGSKDPMSYMNSASSDTKAWLHVVCLSCGVSAPSVKAWQRRTGKK